MSCVSRPPHAPHRRAHRAASLGSIREVTRKGRLLFAERVRTGSVTRHVGPDPDETGFFGGQDAFIASYQSDGTFEWQHATGLGFGHFMRSVYSDSRGCSGRPCDRGYYDMMHWPIGTLAVSGGFAWGGLAIGPLVQLTFGFTSGESDLNDSGYVTVGVGLLVEYAFDLRPP